MKKLTAISILVILALGQCGYFCFYTFQLYTAKKEARHKLLQNVPEKLLTVFNADNSAIRWEDEGKEISVNGKMYDVVKIKEAGGNKWILCTSDDKEDAILKELSSVVKSSFENTGSKNGKNQAPVRLVIQDWLFETAGSSPFSVEAAPGYTKDEYAVYNSALPEIFTEIKSPPPNTNI